MHNRIAAPERRDRTRSIERKRATLDRKAERNAKRAANGGAR